MCTNFNSQTNTTRSEYFLSIKPLVTQTSTHKPTHTDLSISWAWGHWSHKLQLTNQHIPIWVFLEHVTTGRTNFNSQTNTYRSEYFLSMGPLVAQTSTHKPTHTEAWGHWSHKLHITNQHIPIWVFLEHRTIGRTNYNSQTNTYRSEYFLSM